MKPFAVVLLLVVAGCTTSSFTQTCYSASVGEVPCATPTPATSASPATATITEGNSPESVGALPTDYEALVNEALRGRLRDPYSAVVKVGPPNLSQCTTRSGVRFHGWAMPVTYNAKNGYGGYVGERTLTAWIAGGHVTSLLISDDMTPAYLCGTPLG